MKSIVHTIYKKEPMNSPFSNYTTQHYVEYLKVYTNDKVKL